MRVAGACTLCILASGTLVLNAGVHPERAISHESLGCAEAWTSPAVSVSPCTSVVPDAAEILERFLANTSQSLVSYKALRRLTVVARGGKMEALLTAQTSLDPDKGFSYEVLEESGSGFLRSRVLRPVLEAERMAKLREKGAHGALTEANYKFTAGEMTGDGFLRVAIKPKRKDELLMDGSILLTCADSDLVRMEGLLVKRPSFWTRRVQIVRRYGRIGGVRVPLTTGSTADVLFAGQSTFSMSYEYESINGVPVAAGEAEAERPDPTARR